MADPDTFLDALQADILSVLRNTPALANAAIIADDEGDLDSKVEQSLASRRDSAAGKRGLVIIVLRPEVVDAEANLPGPTMDVRIVVQTIENVMFNRDPLNGVGKTSSQAALSVLGALHLQCIGPHLIYARENPLKTLPVKQGHLSRAVTLYSKANGLQGPGKPSQVTAAWQDTAAEWRPLIVTGELTDGTAQHNPVVFPALPYAGQHNGRPSWTGDGQPVGSHGGESCYYDSGVWYLFDAAALWGVSETSDAADPFGLSWPDEYLPGDQGGTPELAMAPASYTVEGTLTDGVDPVSMPPLLFAGMNDGRIAYSDSGSLVSAAWFMVWNLNDSAVWSLGAVDLSAIWTAATDTHDPTALEWTPSAPATGTPLLTANISAGALALACITEGAEIRYTTDGTYPTPAAGTLYTAPVSGLDAGTLVRAAAYQTGLNPGDLTEILITE